MRALPRSLSTDCTVVCRVQRATSQRIAVHGAYGELSHSPESEQADDARERDAAGGDAARDACPSVTWMEKTPNEEERLFEACQSQNSRDAQSPMMLLLPGCLASSFISTLLYPTRTSRALLCAGLPPHSSMPSRAATHSRTSSASTVLERVRRQAPAASAASLCAYRRGSSRLPRSLASRFVHFFS